MPIRGLLPSPNHDFAERFKYDLISSNRLSTSVATSPIFSHSRTRSQSPDPSLPGKLQIPKQDVVEKSKQELKSLSSAFVFVGLAALLNQYRVAAALAMFTSLTVAKSTESTSANKNYVPQMFDALNNLKAAGTTWDSLVNDAVTTLEQEERRYVSSLVSSSQFYMKIMFIFYTIALIHPQAQEHHPHHRPSYASRFIQRSSRPRISATTSAPYSQPLPLPWNYHN